tara:strand:- start:649 stop:852 length:204 start_codon:yes stop_codon:yes gene_type:complete
VEIVMVDGKILQIDDEGNIVHVEMITNDGETVVGVYQLMGWTTAPKAVKAKAELELWVPPKVSHPIQ